MGHPRKHGAALTITYLTASSAEENARPDAKSRPVVDGAGRGGGSVDGVAGAVDDLVKPLCVGRVLGDPTVEGEGDGVEQPKSGARNRAELVKARLVPLLHHLGDAGDVHHALAVEGEDGVIGILVSENGLLVARELAVLGFPLLRQGFDDARHEPGKVALGIGGVLATHHHVGAERQVVADEDLRAKRDADGEPLVVAVP